MGGNKEIKEWTRSLDLILELAFNDFKLKYRNMLFGYVWSIVSPLLMLVTLYFVFTYVIDLQFENYQLFLLLGIIIWNYFSEATTNSLNSLSSNAEMVKKYRVKPIILILSACISSLISFALSFVVFFIMLLFFNVEIKLINLFALLYFGILFLQAAGISFAIGAIYSRFKDIKTLWPFFLTLGFWLTPIIYSEMVIPDNFRRIYMLNPLSRTISHFRNIYINNYIDNFEQIIITIILSVSLFLFGLWVYRRSAKGMGERL